ncbi:UDP-N-acetylmuramyl pentapeptide phosphotransferase/UDP-N-acetylglucosamine-1-phosphate transferase [Siphonobacter aquaeclarae]|jgi:UDP-GlcNAc:undecaprenyl-phosphate GlcNAc-1-phosphate transferase|uniref:UDP-N-acetylmuramyl pentapeptide phosphotransferase/UDP-N-acetylglucosamine-1-phosphate transferase n=2 Tax=Siphonobacter aquaeclarae TaxID=563176 RepID=A0A1G9K9T2_9BACT|nr:undecaprenyl/decaprenyl-phosphate alpha-N-acetylglucosaminyl 1-phosphate transferase [Siphonobacter aquaeclarae]SDL46184.1 UDP-N-acetylmuramyl pentapeptide phosphotransferase/UDP-N-acetylglucosamine-1-phosphate transferase [Siphonobacter aquaeclarae]
MITALRQFLNEPFVQVIVSLLAACWLTVEAIPVIINISRLRNLMKEPEARSAHSNRTPTLGGIAIFAGTMIGYFLWQPEGETHLHHLAIAGILILFFTGVKDDILVIAPVKKMLAQILASSLVIIGADLRINDLFGILGIHQIPYLFSVLFTIFIFIALTNAINLIDGIDGLAGGIGLIASMIFGSWFLLNNQYPLAILAASLSGSLLGFIRFNFSRTSKIFMGDTGSLILGFVLTLFAVKFIHLNTGAGAIIDAPILAVVVLIVPIFDTLRVFIIRIMNRRSPFFPDKNHTHHILIAQGLSHFMATCILCGITIGLTGIFLLIRNSVTTTQSLVILVCLFFVYNYVNYLLIKRVNYVDPTTAILEQQKQTKREAKARLQKIKRMRRLYEN